MTEAERTKRELSHEACTWICSQEEKETIEEANLCYEQCLVESVRGYKEFWWCRACSVQTDQMRCPACGRSVFLQKVRVPKNTKELITHTSKQDGLTKIVAYSTKTTRQIAEETVQSIKRELKKDRRR